ncbi:MAG: helix-turn-helix transcriptional regulator [Opitutaceae bacterium]|nr:helix-turn-helix transcriptional regulator [Opitutaceae bacterium]
MKTSADRKKIVEALNGWLSADRREEGLIRVLSGSRPEGPAVSFFMEAPRLILVLEGVATFLTVQAREERFEVAPGQILFLAPQTWLSPVPRQPYKSLGITLRNDSTRLIITKRKAMHKDSTVVDRYVAQWRTLETLGEKGEALVSLLRGSLSRRLGQAEYMQLGRMLLAEVADLAESAPEHIRPGQTVLWQAVCDYLSEHWSDPKLSRKSTAAYFNRHPNHFSRFFHAHTRKNFRTYLNEVRLERSIRFLRDLRYNVTEVAGLCGFTGMPYFIQCFRQRYGLTPGEYRRRHEK